MQRKGEQEILWPRLCSIHKQQVPHIPTSHSSMMFHTFWANIEFTHN